MGRLFINIISGPSYCTIGAGRESTVLSKLYDMTCFVFLPANMEMCVALEKLFDDICPSADPRASLELLLPCRIGTRVVLTKQTDLRAFQGH